MFKHIKEIFNATPLTQLVGDLIGALAIFVLLGAMLFLSFLYS